MTSGGVSRERVRRPIAPILLGCFFLIATKICLAAGITLLAPGSALDGIWAIKPLAYRQLLAMAPWSGVGFLALTIAMALASVGTFLRTRWGWRLAILIFFANGVGDAAQVVTGHVAEGLIGVLAAGLVIYAISRRGIRSSFGF